MQGATRGIVKDGQVVLDEPLDLPDGTVVEVTARGDDEAAKRALLGALNRLDLLNDPDWRAKCEQDRIAVTEALIRETAGRWANRPETADPDKWVRRLWGRDE